MKYKKDDVFLQQLIRSMRSFYALTLFRTAFSPTYLAQGGIFTLLRDF